MTRSPMRWVVVAVYLVSSALNYLDRLLLAAAAPLILREFQLSPVQYGLILSAVSVSYAIAAPLMGLFVDAVGLRAGLSIAVAGWSLAGAATGVANSLVTLVGSRGILAVAQAAGIPCSGKTNATYLYPDELAIGSGLNQLGISLGSIAAPLLVAAVSPSLGWRAAFLIAGIAGLGWIPVWLWVTTVAPARALEGATPSRGLSEILSDERFWAIAIANAFAMMTYTLWSNWTTLYFVRARSLSIADANQQFAWIPPVFATLGALSGGAMAFHWIRSGVGVRASRMRVCLLSALFILGTAAIPWMPNAWLAAAIISLSFFWTSAMSVNIYVLPIDLFGAGHAAFSIAALTASYGLMQAVLSPLIGFVVGVWGFDGVCVVVSAMPLVAYLILWTMRE